MTSRIPSRSAERFVRDRVRSLLHLEILLLLRRDLRQWLHAPALAASLRVPAEVAERALEELAGANLVDVRIGSHLAFRFAPLDAGLLPVIDEIGALYGADQRVIEELLPNRDPRRPRS